MKLKNKTTAKNIDSVKIFREIKNKISKDLNAKSSNQILEYLRLNSLELQSENSNTINSVPLNKIKKPALNVLFKNLSLYNLS